MTKTLFVVSLAVLLTACEGPWPQLPHNPYYDPAEWRTQPAPEPEVIPPEEPFKPDTQDVGTSGDRTRLQAGSKGSSQ